MSVPTIRGVIRRNLLIVFVIALFAGGGGFYLLLKNAAMNDAEGEARMLLSSALAIRGYTTQHILPNLTKLHDDVFHEETVPAFAAQTVFRTVSAGEHAFTYREAALNPTSVADRAGPFEVELIRLPQIGSERVGEDSVLAHPGDRAAGVEPAGESDPDALSDRERSENRTAAGALEETHAASLCARISSESCAPVTGSRATRSTVFSPATVPATCGWWATSIACASACA